MDAITDLLIMVIPSLQNKGPLTKYSAFIHLEILKAAAAILVDKVGKQLNVLAK